MSNQDTRADQPKSAAAISRAGKVHIGGYFNQDVRAQIKIMAIEQNKTVQQLIGEGLNLLFASHGKAEIVDKERV